MLHSGYSGDITGMPGMQSILVNYWLVSNIAIFSNSNGMRIPPSYLQGEPPE